MKLGNNQCLVDIFKLVPAVQADHTHGYCSK